MQTPVFLFAFANDDAQRLGLDEEWKKAEKALQQRVDDGNLVFNPTSSSNKEDLFDKFQRFHGRITLFHYGGHSGAGELILKGSPLQADTLATLLGQEKQLQLAFLNGCSNAAQVTQRI